MHGRNQTVCKKGKWILNSNACSQNMQSGHKDEIWHRKMYHSSNEKRQLTEWNNQIKTKLEHLKKRKPTNTWGFWKLTPSNKWRWKKKRKKEYSRRTRKVHETKTYQRNKYQGCPPCKIFGTILKVDLRRT